MKIRKIMHEILTVLRKNHLPFSVSQNRHIKISVTNPINAQTALLIISTSPSDVNAEKQIKKKCMKRLERVGVSVSRW